MYRTVPGLHPWTVRSVAQDASGGLWAAFNAAGLSYWQSNAVTDFKASGAVRNAWTILVDQKQKVWEPAQAAVKGFSFSKKPL